MNELKQIIPIRSLSCQTHHTQDNRIYSTFLKVQNCGEKLPNPWRDLPRLIKQLSVTEKKA